MSVMAVNVLNNELCRTLRASYWKCGFISFRLHTGMGITGVVNYNEDDL